MRSVPTAWQRNCHRQRLARSALVDRIPPRATLGLTSRGIGSDSQRLFAIVIVGGLRATMVMNIFLLTTVYFWIARPSDKLPEPEEGFE